MKKIHFITLIFLTLIFLGWSACNDDELPPCPKSGTIIGLDLRRCTCCGGFFIETEGDTLRAPTLPTNFSETFDWEEIPLPVYLDWEPKDPQCLGDEITLVCISRQD